MRLTISNETELAPPVATALREVVDEIATINQVGHSDDGRTKQYVLSAYHPTTQSIPDATWTALLFAAENDLRASRALSVPVGVHSKTTRSDRFIVPGTETRWVRGFIRLTFGASATGSRGIYMAKNSAVAHYLTYVRATSSDGTILSVPFGLLCDPLDELQLFVYQNSGGPLTVGSTARDATTEILFEFL